MAVCQCCLANESDSTSLYTLYPW